MVGFAQPLQDTTHLTTSSARLSMGLAGIAPRTWLFRYASGAKTSLSYGSTPTAVANYPTALGIQLTAVGG
jgi:hypothetical protein